MKNKNLIVQKIPNCYVGENYAQVMIPFTNSILIHVGDSFERDNIICSYNMKDKGIVVVNKYLEDERKNSFPYSDIPLHASYRGIKRTYHVNQLLDFDQDYWCLVDYDVIKDNIWGEEKELGYVMHMYLIKDRDDTFVVSEYYNFNVYDRGTLINIIPKRKYTVEEVKYLMDVKIKKTNTPKFDYKLNPNIDRKKLEESKNLIRKLSK